MIPMPLNDKSLKNDGRFAYKNKWVRVTLINSPQNKTAPNIIVVINKQPPKMLPTAIKIPYSSLAATIAVNKSGAPLAKAMRVIL